MRIVVPREIEAGERRVALVPETVARLVKAGLEVRVEKGAGAEAFFSDAQYEAAGATIVSDGARLLGDAEVVLKVQRPIANPGAAKHEVDVMAEGAVLIGFLRPAAEPELLKRLAARRITAFAMELIPRLSRAQRMDALTSQATVAGYKAALIVADSLPKFFPMLTTAAGTLPPARVLVLGAGVAGLQAIATARRLGAVVEGFDIRPAVKEQVESLGATFVGLALEEAETAGGYAKEVDEEMRRREQEIIHARVREADAVITTAVVPGKRAPVLITEAMVRDMKPGSVIVDLAAEAGGNCELSRPGDEVVRHGVRIHGAVNLASAMPTHASQMYSRNISAFLLNLVRDGKLHLDFEDPIVRESCVTHEGRVVYGRAEALA